MANTAHAPPRPPRRLGRQCHPAAKNPRAQGRNGEPRPGFKKAAQDLNSLVPEARARFWAEIEGKVDSQDKRTPSGKQSHR